MSDSIKPCPVCGSLSIKHIERRDNNGVLGPGYRSWIIESYNSCQECGVRFDELNDEQKIDKQKAFNKWKLEIGNTKDIAIAFAEYVAKRYTLSRYSEWCSLGMPTINSTEDLFNKFIEEYEG